MAFRRTLHRWFERLTRYSDRWWYAPILALFSALDAYIIIVPNEPLVAASALAQPKKWLRLSLWMTLGSALGALSVAAIVSYGSDWIWDHIISRELHHSRTWIESMKLIRHHGLWGLTLISMSPLPQHPAVIIAGLVNMELWKVFFAVLVGRGIKYGGIAYLAAKAPHRLKKWGLLPREGITASSENPNEKSVISRRTSKRPKHRVGSARRSRKKPWRNGRR